MKSPDNSRYIRPLEVEKKEVRPDYASRLQRLREQMKQSHSESALVSSPANVRYLSGFRGLEPEDREAFILATFTSAHLITSSLYPDQVRSAQPLFVFEDIKSMPEAIGRIAQAENMKTVGIEGNHLVVDEQDMLHNLGLQTSKLPVSELRNIKDSSEIEAIRIACNAGDKIFEQIIPFIREGVTERQLVNLMTQAMKDLGYEGEAFPTIVAFGPNTANPHYMPTETRLERNQFVLFDFGLKGTDGYPSDMTRTVFFGREEDITPEQKHVYETVRQANQLVTDYIQSVPIGTIQDGQVTGADLDKIARDFIYSQGYSPENFPHTLGHGLGLQVHEFPSLTQRVRHVLQEGMVFTNEPGVYVEGIGGVRIEDDLVITRNGVEVLTHSPRELKFVNPDAVQK